MNTKSDRIISTESRGACTRPEVGALLPDYFVGLLRTAAAAAVEDHLRACQFCAKDYLTITSIRAAARATASDARPDADRRALGGAQVSWLASFRKRRQ